MMKTVGQYTIMKMPGAREVSLCGGGYGHCLCGDNPCELVVRRSNFERRWELATRPARRLGPPAEKER